ncbi:spore coat U domain-containing protein [Pantoea sp. At-9b]|uniref:Csu type fimbrial protein n=1 Tax=Pantoea sp. (strain At-9b) TaxID=592316 RepID=UPI0001B3E87F|nr:spore coat U domain-containing protein [Pantoea sp. At-9b]ADU68019.1 Spore coat U domain protein [Pantoea sp. At-9b]
MEFKSAVCGLAVAVATVCQPFTAQAAGTLSGQLGIQVIISEGCTVGNNDSSGSTNDWGSINFGTYADLANIIDGSVLGSDGSSTVTVTCTSGLSPTMTLDGGLNGSSTLRNMSSGSTLIPYRLYSDSSRSTEIAVNGSVSLTADGTEQDIPIYGRILPSDQSTTAPASGTYVDTVTATLAW